MSYCTATPINGPRPADYPSASLALAATRVLATLSAGQSQDFNDAESSLIAQLQAEEFVPSSYSMYVEPSCLEHGVVHVCCTPPGAVPPGPLYDVWLQICPTTGAVTRY